MARFHISIFWLIKFSMMTALFHYGDFNFLRVAE